MRKGKGQFYPHILENGKRFFNDKGKMLIKLEQRFSHSEKEKDNFSLFLQGNEQVFRPRGMKTKFFSFSIKKYFFLNKFSKTE